MGRHKERVQCPGCVTSHQAEGQHTCPLDDTSAPSPMLHCCHSITATRCRAEIKLEDCRVVPSVGGLVGCPGLLTLRLTSLVDQYFCLVIVPAGTLPGKHDRERDLKSTVLACKLVWLSTLFPMPYAVIIQRFYVQCTLTFSDSGAGHRRRQSSTAFSWAPRTHTLIRHRLGLINFTRISNHDDRSNFGDPRSQLNRRSRKRLGWKVAAW